MNAAAKKPSPGRPGPHGPSHPGLPAAGGAFAGQHGRPVIMVWYAAMARDLYNGHGRQGLGRPDRRPRAGKRPAHQKGYATYYYLSQDQAWLVKLDESRRTSSCGWNGCATRWRRPEAVALLDGIDAAYKDYAEAKDNVIRLYSRAGWRRPRATLGRARGFRRPARTVRPVQGLFSGPHARDRPGLPGAHRPGHGRGRAGRGDKRHPGLFSGLRPGRPDPRPHPPPGPGDRGKDALAGFSDEVKAIGQSSATWKRTWTRPTWTWNKAGATSCSRKNWPWPDAWPPAWPTPSATP